MQLTKENAQIGLIVTAKIIPSQGKAVITKLGGELCPVGIKYLSGDTAYLDYEDLEICTKEFNLCSMPERGQKVAVVQEGIFLNHRTDQIATVRGTRNKITEVEWKDGSSHFYEADKLLLIEEECSVITLTPEQAKEGTIVLINHKGNYRAQGGTEGVITKLTNDMGHALSLYIYVRWKDGKTNCYNHKDLLFVREEQKRPIQEKLEDMREVDYMKALHKGTNVEYSLRREGNRVHVYNNKGTRVTNFWISSIDNYFIPDTRPKETYRMATDYPYPTTRSFAVSIPEDYLTKQWLITDDKLNDTYDTINLRRNSSSIETATRRVGNPCKGSAGKSLIATGH